MLSSEDSALVVSLNAAAMGPAPVQAMLACLLPFLRADAAALHRDGQMWRMPCDVAGPAPLPAMLQGLRLNRVYTAEELSARGGIDQGTDMRAIGLGTQGRQSWVIVTRKGAGFRASDTARLAALGPHLAQALWVADRLAECDMQARLADLALRRVGIGVVHCPHAGGPTEPDATARALLQAHGLTAAALTLFWPKEGVGDRLVSLCDGLDMLVLDPAQAGAHVALLRAARTPLPGPELLAHALAISPAEARLVAALAQGLDMKQAALAIGVTEQTARHYSKQVYAKTGLSGQAALMRRVWTSGMVLARAAPPSISAGK